MDKVWEVMAAIGSVLTDIGKELYVLIVAASNWLGEYFSANILPLMPTMLKFFSNKKINVILFCTASAYILIINIAAIVMFGSDKKRSKRKQYRISESRLMSVCFWGGAIGGMIGMNAFHHKTLKNKFKIFVPIFFVIQLILHSFVLGFLGFWAFF